MRIRWDRIWKIARWPILIGVAAGTFYIGRATAPKTIEEKVREEPTIVYESGSYKPIKKKGQGQGVYMPTKKKGQGQGVYGGQY
ncbi:MAG: hypothetical protein QXK80_03325 [Candidatus Pacearchaeota archaeon]